MSRAKRLSSRLGPATRAEVRRIREEGKARGVNEEMIERLVQEACKTDEEIEEETARFLASVDMKMSQEQLDELTGTNPPRPLPARSVETLRTWHRNYKTRIPYAPRPWFFLSSREGVWDGEGFVQSGCEWEGDPGNILRDHKGKPRWVHNWDLALLFPDPVSVLEAAIRVSSQTGVHCSVEGGEEYSPGAGWYDAHETRHWMDRWVERVNRRYNAHLEPGPLPHWIELGWLPAGTFYPVSRLCFWELEKDIAAALTRMEEEYMLPTLKAIQERRNRKGTAKSSG